MVDFADLDKVNQLWWEVRNVEAALDNLDNGGVISAMTISAPATTPASPSLPGMPGATVTVMRQPVTISTVDIPYPPQMTASIRASLEERRGKLNDELAALGVTTTPTPAGAGPQPAVARPAGGARTQPAAKPA